MKLLSMEEFDGLVSEFKEDLQREANQWVLKKDVHQAASALCAIDAVDRLAHRVAMRAFVAPNVEEKPKKQVMFHRRTKKQMEEARAAAAKVREIPSKKAAG